MVPVPKAALCRAVSGDVTLVVRDERREDDAADHVRERNTVAGVLTPTER
jgi:hypothetical protein